MGEAKLGKAVCTAPVTLSTAQHIQSCSAHSLVGVTSPAVLAFALLSLFARSHHRHGNPALPARHSRPLSAI